MKKITKSILSNLKESVTVETKAGNDVNEICSWIYDDIHNDLDYLPDKDQMEYIADVTDDEYTEICRRVTEAVKNVENHHYAYDYNDDYIELNDNHTIYELNNDSRSDIDWVNIVNSKVDEFKKETGVDLYLVGRSGRHVCVDNNYYNAIHYYDLKEVQETLEQEAIDEFNGKIEEADEGLYIYSNAESEDKSDAVSMIDAQYSSEAPNLKFKVHREGPMWFVDFIGTKEDIKNYLVKLDWYTPEEIEKNQLIKPYKLNESTTNNDPAINDDPDLNAEQIQADIDYWTELDEANSEDVSGRKPIGVFTLSNTGAIFVYDIEYDINDRILVGDNSDTTKAWWVNINYDDLEDEETGEPIPFFYYDDIKVPMNEVMRTNI